MKHKLIWYLRRRLIWVSKEPHINIAQDDTLQFAIRSNKVTEKQWPSLLYTKSSFSFVVITHFDDKKERSALTVNFQDPTGRIMLIPFSQYKEQQTASRHFHDVHDVLLTRLHALNDKKVEALLEALYPDEQEEEGE